MIKMLIADDERLIREGMMTIANWEEYGVDVVGAASDGEQAMRLFEEHAPQIVITDIHMPKASGLELARFIRERDETVKVAILSGYEEFSYAQQALKLGIEDYLLKPLLPDKFVDKVMELKTAYEDEQQRLEERSLLRRQIGEAIPLLKERFLCELVYGQLTDMETVSDKLRFLGISLREEAASCSLLVQLDGFDAAVDFREEERQLLQCSVLNCLRKAVSGKGEAFSIRSSQFCLVVHLESHTELPYDAMKRLGEEIKAQLQAHCGIGATIGIGNPCVDLLGIHESFAGAQEALKYKVLLGGGQIIWIGDLDIRTGNAPKYPETAEKDMIFTIQNADKSRIRLCLDEFFRFSSGMTDFEYVKVMAMKLFFSVSMALMEIGENPEDFMDSEMELWDQFKKMETLPEIKLHMIAILEQISNALLDKRNSKNKKVIERVTAYLNDHYSEPLSLQRLSEVVFLSPNYICSMYKEETGQNISDYLMMLRIEKAKALLQDETIKIYEIADRVGYSDSRYFSKLFKKYTGTSLSEYRDRM